MESQIYNLGIKLQPEVDKLLTLEEKESLIVSREPPYYHIYIESYVERNKKPLYNEEGEEIRNLLGKIITSNGEITKRGILFPVSFEKIKLLKELVGDEKNDYSLLKEVQDQIEDKEFPVKPWDRNVTIPFFKKAASVTHLALLIVFLNFSSASSIRGENEIEFYQKYVFSHWEKRFFDRLAQVNDYSSIMYSLMELADWLDFQHLSHLVAKDIGARLSSLSFSEKAKLLGFKLTPEQVRYVDDLKNHRLPAEKDFPNKHEMKVPYFDSHDLHDLSDHLSSNTYTSEEINFLTDYLWNRFSSSELKTFFGLEYDEIDKSDIRLRLGRLRK